jgi:UDP-N-acetylmuramyl pentapeptide phosphotransferase/UDP-N-acetylglucosamine-1-phosphate transferase
VTRLTWTLIAGAVGALAALWMTARSLASPPEWSLRTNVSGKRVPAVLGVAVVFGGAIAMAVLHVAAVLEWVDRNGEVDSAALIVFLAMAAAGTWDDRRGDESPRGFGGHLRAGRLTGGLVKIAAGGLSGLAAGLIVYPDRLAMAGLTALAVPLTANLFNLLDRAPGRTGKVALLVALPLLALGHVDWALAAAGPFGALAAVLPSDLGERGMLGDAGANPLGALAGLGLAVSLDVWPLTAVVVALLALNAASERWSFSAVIERTPLLRRLDSIGRK